MNTYFKSGRILKKCLQAYGNGFNENTKVHFFGILGKLNNPECLKYKNGSSSFYLGRYINFSTSSQAFL